MRALIIIGGILAIIGGGLLIPRKAWALPSNASEYAPDIMAAEMTNGIPTNLLGRLLWQESRFRPDIINGQTISSAGAVGIAQIVPRWHPTVDPLNPVESIYYAAGYLRDLYDRFGQWELALAAYNWGQGNVSRALREKGENWFSALPKETRNYVTEITGDIPVRA